MIKKNISTSRMNVHLIVEGIRTTVILAKIKDVIAIANEIFLAVYNSNFINKISTFVLCCKSINFMLN